MVTRAENATHPVPSDAVLAAWAGATGAGLDTLTDLAQRAKSGTPDWFMPYRHAESEARILRYWSTLAGTGRRSRRELHARAVSKTKVTCSTASMSLLPPGLSGKP